MVNFERITKCLYPDLTISLYNEKQWGKHGAVYSLDWQIYYKSFTCVSMACLKKQTGQGFPIFF